MTRRTDAEVMELLRSDTPINRVREIFSGEAGRIEQAGMQRNPCGPIEARRMEFEAVERIAAALGIGFTENGNPTVRAINYEDARRKIVDEDARPTGASSGRLAGGPP